MPRFNRSKRWSFVGMTNNDLETISASLKEAGIDHVIAPDTENEGATCGFIKSPKKQRPSFFKTFLGDLTDVEFTAESLQDDLVNIATVLAALARA